MFFTMMLLIFVLTACGANPSEESASERELGKAGSEFLQEKEIRMGISGRGFSNLIGIDEGY